MLNSKRHGHPKPRSLSLRELRRIQPCKLSCR
jgi:hypothetical protein